MILYTPDQIFDLIGSVSCETDLLEIEHYVLSHSTLYTGTDMYLFAVSINDLYQIFNK